MKMSDIMAYLVSRQVAGLPLSAIANVFDDLIWCMDDNGGDVELVREAWLLSDNKSHVEVAISMNSTYPFETREEMLESFERICKKWPDLRSKCDEMLYSWDKSFPS